MAIQYSKASGNMYAEVLYQLQNNKSLTIYGGTQPSSQDIITNWNAKYRQGSTDPAAPLLHLTSVALDRVTGNWLNTTLGYGSIINNLVPTPTNAFVTGIATWAIWWSTAATLANIQSSSIPSSSFIVLPVTDYTGNGIVKLTSTNLTAGSSYTIASLSLITYIEGAI